MWGTEAAHVAVLWLYGSTDLSGRSMNLLGSSGDVVFVAGVYDLPAPAAGTGVLFAPPNWFR